MSFCVVMTLLSLSSMKMIMALRSMGQTIKAETLDNRINKSKVITYSLAFLLYNVAYIFVEIISHWFKLKLEYTPLLLLMITGSIANYCLFRLLWSLGTVRKHYIPTHNSSVATDVERIGDLECSNSELPDEETDLMFTNLSAQ